jgi:nitroreductase
MTLPASAIPAAPKENDPVNAANESADMLALLARRRSTKIAHFVEPGPSPEQIDALIALSTRVPDHGKIGPWRFVVIDGDARARAGEALAQRIANDEGVDEARLAGARGMFLRAPSCVMVVSSPKPSQKVPEWEQLMSAGAACFALLLGAHAMGFAGAWITEWPAFDARARKALGLAEHEQVAGFVYLGTAREPAIERVRANADGRVTRF